MNSNDPAYLEAKKQVFDYVRNNLGAGMIDVELDDVHLETALTRALDKFRQRSENSVEESYGFLTLQEDTNEYILSDQVISVREIFRRSIGSRTGSGQGGTLFEPFNLAYTNTYLLRTGHLGGLATYYLFASYQELVGKMFGSFINFTFNPANHKLTITQRPRITDGETVLLWLYNHKPDVTIMNDVYAKPWIRDYSLAVSKYMLGEARSKFGTIAGPQGGTSLNGDALKADAQAQMEKLEEDLRNYVAGGNPLTFVIG